MSARSSSTLFWTATLALLALTVGAKLLAVRPAETTPPAERLGSFLRAAGVQDLLPTGYGLSPPYAQGWSFRVGGCSARAFPQAIGGEDESRVRGLAAPGERVEYAVDGALRTRPPDGAERALRVLQRAGRALTGSGEAVYVAVIESPACPVAEKLPWARL